MPMHPDCKQACCLPVKHSLSQRQPDSARTFRFQTLQSIVIRASRRHLSAAIQSFHTTETRNGHERKASRRGKSRVT
jgi:hypothetical protein